MPCRGPILAIVVAILIPFFWCFGSTLTGTRVCAYRDIAHFYYPLYAWTSRTWSRGEIPLWNPQENIGTPVAAEATSALFYPGQLLFALPLRLLAEVQSLYCAPRTVGRLRRLCSWLANCFVRDYGPMTAAFRAPANIVAAREPASGSSCRTESPGGRVLCRVLCLQRRRAVSVLQHCFSGRGCLVTTFPAGRGPHALPAQPALGTWTGCLPGVDDARRRPTVRVPRWLVDRTSGFFPATRSGFPAMEPTAALQRAVRHIVAAVRQHAVALLTAAAVSGVALSAIQIVPALPWTRASDRAAFEYPRKHLRSADVSGPHTVRTRAATSSHLPDNATGLAGGDTRVTGTAARRHTSSTSV